MSSANADLEELARRKRRLLVLNKADLANAALSPAVAAQLREGDWPVLFTSCSDSRAGRAGRELLEAISTRLRAERPQADALLVMLVGVPNCGKSSLVNALRRAAAGASAPSSGAAAVVGPTPGLTRRISSFRLLASPPTHVLDTPGVMLPRIPDLPTGLKLALSGAIKDSVVGEERLARFLLRTLVDGAAGRGRAGRSSDDQSLGDEGDEGDEVIESDVPQSSGQPSWAELGCTGGARWARLRDAALALPAFTGRPQLRRHVAVLGDPWAPPADQTAAARAAAGAALLRAFRAGELGRLTLDRIAGRVPERGGAGVSTAH